MLLCTLCHTSFHFTALCSSFNMNRPHCIASLLLRKWHKNISKRNCYVLFSSSLCIQIHQTTLCPSPGPRGLNCNRARLGLTPTVPAKGCSFTDPCTMNHCLHPGSLSPLGGCWPRHNVNGHEGSFWIEAQTKQQQRTQAVSVPKESMEQSGPSCVCCGRVWVLDTQCRVLGVIM